MTTARTLRDPEPRKRVVADEPSRRCERCSTTPRRRRRDGAVVLAASKPLTDDLIVYLVDARELLGLRWRDVDFRARRVRVVAPYMRGQFNDPKSEDSGRSIPMADRAADSKSGT
jgi:integrase